MKVRELLTSEEVWTKDCHARNKSGGKVNPNSESAIKWSLIGAIFKCYELQREEEFEVRLKVVRVLEEVGPLSISMWNDLDNTTFEDVQNLVLKLDI